GANVGRYSFIGFEPRRNLRIDAKTANPVQLLNGELVPLRVRGEDKLPPFFGGAVGYFRYGASTWNEPMPEPHPNGLGIPDAKLLFFDNVVVFDHVLQRLYVVANVFTKDGSLEDAERRLDRAIERLDHAIDRLRRASVDPIALPHDAPAAAFRSNFTREGF